jgi:hypothetical protein
MSAAGWFYVQDDKRLGPVDVDHIVHLVVTAALAPSALVWHHGLAEWTEANRVPELMSLLPPPLPPGKKPGPLEPPPLPARPAPEKHAEPAPAAAAPANPKLEELRRRLEKEPSPRAYGQLAEELRKAGEHAEAIRICREGVEKSPAYPTLRLTLGRALLESGDLQAARVELEKVLQAAPDNILAERFLGECLEALGDRAGARAQYLKALALAPGDAQLVARLRTLHGGDGPAGPEDAASAMVVDVDPPSAPPPPAPDDPLAGVLDDTNVETPVTSEPSVEEYSPPPPRSAPVELPPIPLVAVEETFEIERANDIAAGTTPQRKRKAAGEGGKSGGTPKPTPTPVLIDLPAEMPGLVLDTSAVFEPPPAPAPAPPAPPPGPPPVPAVKTRASASPPTASVVAPAPVRTPPPAPMPVPPPVPKPQPAAAAAPVAVPDTPVAWPTGRLADHEFADLIREVYSRRWSGLLTLNHMGMEKSVRVQEGRLVFAFSSARDDRLGELLLRRGRITLHQYVDASRAMGKGLRLGTVLVEQGALDARELVKVVMDHTLEIIYSAFQWMEGLYHFTEGGQASEPITLKLSTPDVILEGIRRVDLWSRVERAVGPMETRYVRARGYEKVLSEMTLSLEKLSILTGLDTEQDVGTICKSSTLSHFEVCRTLWAYRVIGVVQRLA